MPIPNSWGKGTATDKSSALTGIFPNACAVGGKVATSETLGAASSATDSGVFIPFSNLTGIDYGIEIGNAASATTVGLANKPAGGARFLLEEKIGERMSHQRVDQLMETNPDTIAVSCPFCVLMLEDALKAKNLQNKVKVKDVSELAN